ncbi:MAG TPA: hypothetical protein VMW49_02460 [Candidatus Dormibacteraeota bacterium]|nr:hypothetical protein [Candidatus Dormibacteraeota bacterium]
MTDPRSAAVPCWLAVDAATRGAGLVAVVSADGTVRAGSVVAGDEAALSIALRAALAAAGPHLRGVVAGHGPGSYTGLRVGLAAALGVAQGRDLPLWTVPSLEVTAWRLDPVGAACVVVHGAGRSAHFRQRFLARAGRWVPAAEGVWLPRGTAPEQGVPAGELLLWEPEGPEPGAAPVRDRLAALGRCALAATGSARPVGYHAVHAEYGVPWT